MRVATILLLVLWPLLVIAAIYVAHAHEVRFHALERRWRGQGAEHGERR